jgi:FOG: Transposase
MRLGFGDCWWEPPDGGSHGRCSGYVNGWPFWLDEAGFLKEGEHSGGADRQYFGTAWRIDNFRIDVFRVFTTEHGGALINGLPA